MSNGEEEKQEGIARVSANADPTWVRRAKAAFVHCALTQDRFNTDAVWLLLDERGVERPAEMRVMVRIVTWALKQGVIEPIVRGDIEPSTRPESHRGNRQMYTASALMRDARAEIAEVT